MAPLRASLDLFKEAGTDRLRAKSVAMTTYLLQGINERLDDSLEILSPEDSSRRGSQLSLRVRSGRSSGRALFAHLEENGILTDWREPDVIRVAPVPLYNSFRDCYTLLHCLTEWQALRGIPSGR